MIDLVDDPRILPNLLLLLLHQIIHVSEILCLDPAWTFKI
jgi:hypothetical protein